jgi:hypothetical protein
MTPTTEATESAHETETEELAVQPSETANEEPPRQTVALAETSPDVQEHETAEPVPVQDDTTPEESLEEDSTAQDGIFSEAVPPPPDTLVADSPSVLQAETHAEVDTAPSREVEPIEAEPAVVPEDVVLDATPAAEETEVESTDAPVVEEVAPELAAELVPSHEEPIVPEKPAQELEALEIPTSHTEEEVAAVPISIHEESVEAVEPEPEQVAEDSTEPTSVSAEAGLKIEELKQDQEKEGASKSNGDVLPTFVEVEVEETHAEESQTQEPSSTPVLELPQDAEERPKSPWTPSYSVISQGGGSPSNDQEVGELEQLPPAVTEDILIPESTDSAIVPEAAVEVLYPEILHS